MVVADRVAVSLNGRVSVAESMTVFVGVGASDGVAVPETVSVSTCDTVAVGCSDEVSDTVKVPDSGRDGEMVSEGEALGVSVKDGVVVAHR